MNEHRVLLTIYFYTSRGMILRKFKDLSQKSHPARRYEFLFPKNKQKKMTKRRIFVFKRIAKFRH
jgi:hypothetical protein